MSAADAAQTPDCIGGLRPHSGGDTPAALPNPSLPITATVDDMAHQVSIQELRNSTSSVVSALEAGARLTLTVDDRPIADIIPRAKEHSPWIPSAELRRIVRDVPADPKLLDGLAEVRRTELRAKLACDEIRLEAHRTPSPAIG